MAFYDIYYDLAVQLNDTASDSLVNTKIWTNWTLRDICNMYEFPQLYKTVSITGTDYDFNRIKKLTANSVISLFSDSALDDTSITGTVYGYTISSGARTYQTEDIALNGTITASGSTSFSFIDRIEFSEAINGNVTISAQSGIVKGVALPGETEISNDYKRIIKIDSSGDVAPMTLADRKLKWTNDSNINEKIYTETGSSVDIFGTSGASIVYLRKHPYLINDYDESPIITYGGVEESDIVEAARLGWGLRFEDEADGVMGKQSYKMKLSEIIANIIPGGDDFRRVQNARRR